MKRTRLGEESLKERTPEESSRRPNVVLQVAPEEEAPKPKRPTNRVRQTPDGVPGANAVGEERYVTGSVQLRQLHWDELAALALKRRRERGKGRADQSALVREAVALLLRSEGVSLE